MMHHTCVCHAPVIQEAAKSSDTSANMKPISLQQASNHAPACADERFKQPVKWLYDEKNTRKNGV